MPSGPITSLVPIQTNAGAPGNSVVSALAQGTVDEPANSVVSAVAEGIADAVATNAVSAVAEGTADAIATNAVSAVTEGDASADADGNALGRVAGKSYTGPSGLDVQVDGAPQGGVGRRNLNLTDTANEPAHPAGGQGATAFDLSLFISELGAQGFRFPELGRLATVGGIDALVATDYPLYTVPAGFEAVIMSAPVLCTAAAAISSPASASLGSNAGSFDDLFPAQALTGLTAAGLAFTFPEGGLFTIAPAGSVVTLRITAAAVGTSQALAVHLTGYSRPTS